MLFVEKKYLYRQHRYLYDSNHIIHKKREYTMRVLKRRTSILDRENSYDEYFMNWFCGFVDSSCFFKFSLAKKYLRPTFFFMVFHKDYKLLRWIRYQFNFGEVIYTFKHKRFVYFVINHAHMLILIEVLNGYLRMLRSTRQFYIWLKYYNFCKNTDYYFQINQEPQNLVLTTYLMGLIDCLGHFRISQRLDADYKFKCRIRFSFYMDLPASEIELIKLLSQLFISPTLYVKSGNKIRFLLSKIDDCSILSGYLIRRRPFNRYLKMRFINWYTALQYLYFKKIKYRRKDRVFKLLYNFRSNYYYVPERKKQPRPLHWFDRPEDIQVD